MHFHALQFNYLDRTSNAFNSEVLKKRDLGCMFYARFMHIVQPKMVLYISIKTRYAQYIRSNYAGL